MDTFVITSYALAPHNPLFAKVIPICMRLCKLGRQIAKMLTIDWTRLPAPIRDYRLAAMEAEYKRLYGQYDAIHELASIESPPLPPYYLSARA